MNPTLRFFGWFNDFKFKPAPAPEVCLSSIVDSRQVELDGGTHAAAVTHRCGLKPDHKGPCVCGQCPRTWQKWISR